MKLRRWSASLLTAALFVPALTACGSGDPTTPGAEAATTAGPAIPADPREALLASTKELQQGDYTFTVASDGPTSGSGTLNLPAASAEIRVTIRGPEAEDLTIAAHHTHIDGEQWIKVDVKGALLDYFRDLKAMNGKYQKVDPARAEGVEGLTFDRAEDYDPAGGEELVKAASDIEKAGEGRYTGTVDLTKATDAGAIDEEFVKELGGKAAAVPFTATLDPQGRLTELVLTMPAAGGFPAHDVAVKYADYGAAPEVKKPPADKVVKAADRVYTLFES
ncbi:hypothetical protein [Micromonospora sp. SH-82]|uniref:hypothetical protein n=1 Tax=Micromonospora sp. SH-82 TaxID=3132938 RepID=UPI003EBB4175